MKTKAWILTTMVLVFLSGCSGDPYEKYLGLWERTDRDGNEVMEIIRDGESILMSGNILMTKDVFGQATEPKYKVLKKHDGQLTIDSMLGSSVFGLSEDEDTLRVSTQTYTRTTRDMVNAISANLAKKAAEKEADKQKCDALRDKYQGLLNQAKEKYAGDWQQKGEAIKAINDQHNAEKSLLTNCLF